MKKLLLASAAIVATLGASAANLVVNGDFENPNFKQEVPSGYTWEPWNTQQYHTELPGWTLNTNGPWNGGIELKSGEDFLGDGDVRPDDDMAYAHFVGFNDNGWADIAMYQVVEGLTPGTEYTLSFLMSANFPDASQTANNWAPDPNCGFVVAEPDVNADGETVAGFGILAVNVAADADYDLSDEMDLPYVAKFTAPAVGKVYLKFYLSNTYGDKNKKDNLWMDLDMVSLMTSEEAAGVAEIEIAGDNAPVEYFNLQGVRVTEPAAGGLYIRRQGDKATKVIL